VPDLLVLAVTKQECNWDDQAIGDNGESFGPFQLYQIAHPNTDQLAVSAWANYGINVIYQRWESTWQMMSGPVLWADLVRRLDFLTHFAPIAQGSIAWSLELAAERYSESLEMLELLS
jgi:hypothetical protein